MNAQRKPHLTTEKEYWDLNKASPIKLEFLCGQIVQWNSEVIAMTGSTPAHACLTANLIAAMGAAL